MCVCVRVVGGGGGDGEGRREEVDIERGKKETGSLRVGSLDSDVRSIDQEK